MYYRITPVSLWRAIQTLESRPICKAQSIIISNTGSNQHSTIPPLSTFILTPFFLCLFHKNTKSSPLDKSSNSDKIKSNQIFSHIRIKSARYKYFLSLKRTSGNASAMLKRRLSANVWKEFNMLPPGPDKKQRCSCRRCSCKLKTVNLFLLLYLKFRVNFGSCKKWPTWVQVKQVSFG